MRVCVHIGMPKTGTSSIQAFLYANHALLKKQGYLYPLSVISRSPHHHEHRLLVRPWPELAVRLRREIRRNPGRDVILSQENLAVELPRRGQLTAFLNFLLELGADGITIVIYLREIGEIFASMCCESLKYGLDLTNVMPQDARYLGINLDYRDILQNWCQVFGRENLRVRVFSSSEFSGGDLLRDFAQTAGIGWNQNFAVPKPQNRGLSLLEIELLNNINRILDRDADTHRGRALKRRIFSSLNSYMPKDRGATLRYAPQDQICQAYCTYFAPGCQWVCEHFFAGRRVLFSAPDQAVYHENCRLTQLSAEHWEIISQMLLELAADRRLMRLPGADFRDTWLKRLHIWRELHLP